MVGRGIGYAKSEVTFVRPPFVLKSKLAMVKWRQFELRPNLLVYFPAIMTPEYNLENAQ